MMMAMAWRATSTDDGVDDDDIDGDGATGDGVDDDCDSVTDNDIKDDLRLCIGNNYDTASRVAVVR